MSTEPYLTQPHLLRYLHADRKREFRQVAERRRAIAPVEPHPARAAVDVGRAARLGATVRFRDCLGARSHHGSEPVTSTDGTAGAACRAGWPSEGSGLPAMVVAAIRGDERAWSVLVERFSPLVSSIVRTFRLTPADADDIGQTVWLYLVEHLADLREPRALPGWIITTTRREAMRVRSGERRVEPVDPQEDRRLDRIDRRDVAAHLLSAERRQAVRDGLSELPTLHRELLLLTVADPDVPYRQIGRRLGIPTGSIGPTRARTLRKLGDTEPVRALAS